MFKVVSLFSGCGGGDVGLHGGFNFLDNYYSPLQFETIFANEINQKIANIFEKNIGIKPDVRDIREVSNEDVPSHDLLVGGFPCVSFSIVAQNPPRLGIENDISGKLFFEMIRILKDKQPKAFIAENVKGLLSANKGQAIQLILSEFEKAGYNVKYRLLNSADFGVPQKRERVFIVGIRKDIDQEYTFPEPKYFSKESLFTPKYRSLKEVIFDEKDIPDKYYFSERAVEGLMRAKKQMNKGRAQDINNPCNTVGAHLAKVSLNSTDPVLKIDEKYRRFMPREVARIQSFPDSFELLESESTQYIALGNAIPPVLMWNVAESLLTLLNNEVKKEYIPIEIC
ncbi:DNA cytosine methyltransferase [Planococcus sp. 107-1]|uniref:DNA cytosine methyltransferase n=1 Tax=Planococcus sp. 107-1 TaxID=2908840 RepID=UPI001F37C7B3|nr:DNA (cytosine-5-)-methyltransferase [Planococcus sp. 107-1]UJF26668.1 DNA (cytosine-5-)-methyltransferase [Planococcus sp. 107-1]